MRDPDPNQTLAFALIADLYVASEEIYPVGHPEHYRADALYELAKRHMRITMEVGQHMLALQN